MERNLVVVSREWHKPNIRVSVDDVGIAVTMLLPDFIEALAVELKADEAERARLFAAAERVVTGMKQETAKAM